MEYNIYFSKYYDLWKKTLQEQINIMQEAEKEYEKYCKEMNTNEKK